MKVPSELPVCAWIAALGPVADRILLNPRAIDRPDTARREMHQRVEVGHKTIDNDWQGPPARTGDHGQGQDNVEGRLKEPPRAGEPKPARLTTPPKSIPAHGPGWIASLLPACILSFNNHGFRLDREIVLASMGPWQTDWQATSRRQSCPLST
jgi:hypothetical protein